MPNNENPDYEPDEFPPQDSPSAVPNKTLDAANQNRRGFLISMGIIVASTAVFATIEGVESCEADDRKAKAKELHDLAYSLEKGDKGQRVRNLQNFLVKCDFLSDNNPAKSAIDGEYESKTKNAVNKYKEMLGKTKVYAEAFCPTQEDKHKKNTHVESLQKVLTYFGYLEYGDTLFDGSIGKKTFAAQQLYFRDVGVVEVTCPEIED